MALDERSRHELYLRLEETLGPEAATTLMEHLPPVGWADVATKRDLEHAVALLRADLRTSEHHVISAMRNEILTHVTSQIRAVALTVIGTVMSTATLAFAAAHFL
jgi:hypothetical protein